MLNVFYNYYYCYIHFFPPFFKSMLVTQKSNDIWKISGCTTDIFVDEADSDVFMFRKV